MHYTGKSISKGIMAKCLLEIGSNIIYPMKYILPFNRDLSHEISASI
jgi:hypothetical protein